ncbi:glycosyltransferase family 2 protein [Maribellus sp. YY47]|uniref:glycosyltransferase family 2 protein n=1 Tax=Maribellus sp. YY47 TaxID=2929486 RepID=UPI0020006B32|nr:glycosyltransferase family 2 protein [Maribellus sp. YY47]MCK3685718.1 glycosyltransferase family 2 protein [Maribellus sp. YY47]
MTSNPKIAIVILNWNGVKLFPDFLPSLIEHSKGDNIDLIVADNGSTDDSLAFLEKNFPSVTLLDLKTNYGFAKGYNVALDQIDADYFVLVNSDVKVSKNWIQPCIQHFESDKTVAAVQPKILSYHQPEYFEYAGAAGGFIDQFGYPFCRGRILDKVEKDEGQYQTPGEIFWASGACMFVRAEVFKSAGGFDPLFWAHMEEIDLCWRLKNRGLKIVYEPKSIIFHLGGGSLSYGDPRKVYLNFRNNLYMLYKNLPKNKFKRILFIRMVLDGVAAAKFLLGFEGRAFLAVAKAHATFYKNLAKLRKSRTEIQQHTLLTDHPEIFRQSIMWKFFIQKKQTFSSLNFKPE